MTYLSDVYGKVLADMDIPSEIIKESRNFLVEHKNVLECLCSPAISLEEKRNIIKDFFEKNIGAFFNVVCENERMENIFDIFDSYDKLILERNNIGKAVIYYAQPITDKQLEDIKIMLCRVENKKDFKISLIQDSSLIGGISIKSGNTVYERSIRKGLEKLKNKILQEVRQ